MTNITKLPDGHYFVFGSNEAGRHGRGAGAVWAGWVIDVWEDDNHNIVRFETKDAYYVFAGGGDDAAKQNKGK